MTENLKCILITGMGHSATRLLVKMLDEHPDVWVPNPVEFIPLHSFFLRSIDLTPLWSGEYNIDRTEFFFIMDAYMQKVDTGKLYFVLKLPYFPLNCLDLFVDYFKGRCNFIYTSRPKEKVIKSYLNRGEDRTLFKNDLIRYTKYLDVEQRKYFLSKPDSIQYFQQLYDHCDQLQKKWSANNPAHSFITVDMEEMGQSTSYLINLLQKMNLSTAPAKDMIAAVDLARLLIPTAQHRTKRRFKNIIQNLMPPFIWTLFNRFTGSR